MRTGLPPAPHIAPNSATIETPSPTANGVQPLLELLFAQPQTIEIVCIRNAAFVDVMCFARRAGDFKFVQDKWELDSGDWLLVRISDATPGETDAGGLQRVVRTRAALSADKDPNHG